MNGKEVVDRLFSILEIIKQFTEQTSRTLDGLAAGDSHNKRAYGGQTPQGRDHQTGFAEQMMRTLDGITAGDSHIQRACGGQTPQGLVVRSSNKVCRTNDAYTGWARSR